jgi:hypothetical protein
MAVSLKDIKLIFYLIKLPNKFNTAVDQICLANKEDTTTESVYKMLKTLDQRHDISKTMKSGASPTANLAASNGKIKPSPKSHPTSSSSTSDAETKAAVKDLYETVANLSQSLKQFRTGSGAGRGRGISGRGDQRNGGGGRGHAGRGYTPKPTFQNLSMRDGLPHDPGNNPFQPTAWEKTKQCVICQSSGHMKRTCSRNEDYQRRKSEAGLTGKFLGKRNHPSSGGGGKQGGGPAHKRVNFYAELDGFPRNPRRPPTSGPEFKSDIAGDGPSDDDDQPPSSAKKRKKHRGKLSKSPMSLTFIADSGCNQHMIGSKSISTSDLLPHLTHVSSINPVPVSTAGGTYCHGTQVGTYGPLSDVLIVPDLSRDLLSIQQLCVKGYKVIFGSDGVSVYRTSQVECSGSSTLTGEVTSNGLYEIDVPSIPPIDPTATPTSSSLLNLLADVRPENTYTLWHQRLGHVSHRTLGNMIRHKAAPGISVIPAHSIEHRQCLCPGCALGKMKMAPQRKKKAHAASTAQQQRSAPGRLIMADVLFSPTPSVSGKYTCALLIIDACTRYTWVYFMRAKDEAPAQFTEWLGWMRAYNKHVEAFTTIRTDNGGEFVNRDLDAIFLRAGLKKEMSAPYAHCNLVERAIQTVQSNARAMLLAASLTPGFWAEALNTAVFLFNRTTNTNNAKKTPYELFLDRKPDDMTHLRTFGCQAFVKIPRDTNPTASKWSPQAIEGRFMGYDEQHPTTWRVWLPSKHTMTISNSVIFNEHLPTSANLSLTDSKVITEELFRSLAAVEFTEASVPSSESSLSRAAAGGAATAEFQPKRSKRVPIPTPNYLASTFTFLRSNPSNAAHEFSSNLSALAAAADTPRPTHRIPTSLKQALIEDPTINPYHAQWRAAIEAEIQSLVTNQTFSIVERTSNMRVLAFKWVFKVKEDMFGEIARFKARCTALGNLQREGFDYEETFSPVVRFTTIRTLLAITAVQNLELHQMDVDTAFLYGLMNEEPDLYFEVPYNYPIPSALLQLGKRLVAKAIKAIYGLKQAPRLWNEHVDNTMTKHGFRKSPYDPCLYERRTAAGVVYVTIYVDDLIIAASTMALIHEFKEELKSVYSMKDLGELKFCLGMEITRDRSRRLLTVRQSKYARDVLTRFGMTTSHPKPTPMDPGLKLSKTMSPKNAEEAAEAAKFPYREVVGSLMYLMVSTRPDIIRPE